MVLHHERVAAALFAHGGPQLHPVHRGQQGRNGNAVRYFCAENALRRIYLPFQHNRFGGGGYRERQRRGRAVFRQGVAHLYAARKFPRGLLRAHGVGHAPESAGRRLRAGEPERRNRSRRRPLGERRYGERPGHVPRHGRCPRRYGERLFRPRRFARTDEHPARAAHGAFDVRLCRRGRL